MKLRLCRQFAAAAFFLASAAAVHAQDVLQAKSDEGLKGMSSEQVADRYGPPDKKSSPGAGRETWYYGKSMILIEEGRVKAWSDAGDLQGRFNLGTIKDDTSGEDDRQTLSSWQNAWTPRKRVSAQDILQDLMEKE